MGAGVTETVQLTREVFATEGLMGQAVGRDVADLLRETTAERSRPVVLNLAAAPSQDAFLAALVRQEGIDWGKVQVIHLDEYFDLPRNHPNTFEVYLRDHIISLVPVPDGNVHFIKAVEADSPSEVARLYEAQVRNVVEATRAGGGIYVACIGIGVNGHIAFNEPNTVKRTGRMVIPVRIDEVSVQQQYYDYKDHPNPDARYDTMGDVPRRAVTLSCAGILDADRVFCAVPGRQKAEAVRAMWDGPITNQVPASLLRMHPRLNLYLDAESASLLDRKPALD